MKSSALKWLAPRGVAMEMDAGVIREILALYACLNPRLCGDGDSVRSADIVPHNHYMPRSI